MTTPAPCTAIVTCADGRHRLRWQDGTLRALDHPDPERERALTALGGGSYRCLQLLDVWERHVTDLDVLLLASRGAQDQVTRNRDDVGDGHLHGSHRGVRYGGRYTSFGTSSYAPLSTTIRSGSPLPTLEDVLRLDGRLPERLTAQVVAHWSGLLENGDVEAVAARPRLHAALYGRFAATVREWLGEPELRIALEMSAAAAPRRVRRDDAGLAVSLPFAWLVEVWSPGLAVVADRLVLAGANPRRGHVELVALDRDLVERAVVLDERREDLR